ncbi:hypothetical protein ECC02_011829 [Trypanosoma cruzi]|uniref:Uncharacterized protein n=1 Tax=Trypanosoma cruzi TaxID=5693 RepID=A0A7J6XLU4_TRYCR|nr:hypothetical protein ECC02_011829 [Trypanosoma cruzi]
MNRSDLPKTKEKRVKVQKNSQKHLKKEKIDSERSSFHVPRSTIQSCVWVCILPATRKRGQRKDLTVPPAHKTSFTFHAASGPFFQSSFRAVRGTHSRGAGTACGQKQTKGGNTSLMTVCSRHPLSKEDSENARLDGNTFSTAPHPPSPHGGRTHPSTEKKNKRKRKTRRQGVAVAVCGAAGVCPPSPQENKTRGREMCAPPHRPSSHAHTSRLPQRAVRRGPSSCVQQARRTGPSS